jgi:recombinational DNA repair ATPase RecF
VDDALLDVVLQRLDQVPLPDQAASLLLAALDGDEALARELDAGPGTERHIRSRPAPAAAPAAKPAGAYLRSLTVSGFRGIGPGAKLEVQPKPGLTLVTGRNGSGKSSFAEAMEVLLTGTLLRWKSANSTVFRDSWQSKHADSGTRITATFLIEGRGEATAERSWPQGAKLDTFEAWFQVAGEQRQSGLGGLDWDRHLTTYRPFLSHAELEAFFDSPSVLHDLLASVLGLEPLKDANDRLGQARKQRAEKLKKNKDDLEPLLGRLRVLDDERAETCLTALSKRTWDIPAARESATGGGPPSGQLGLLRQLTLLVPPMDDNVSNAITRLLFAADTQDSATGSSAEQSRQLAELLEAALRHHETHGDGSCPVCGRAGALTGQWQGETRQHVTRLREEARVAQEAITVAAKAAEEALALMQSPPPVLAKDVEGIDAGPARAAWRAWAGRPADVNLTSSAGLRALAEHIDAAATDLAEAITTLTAAAAAELSRRDDKWAPLASEITAWCADAEAALRASQPVKALKDAKTWLTDATDDLRNARLEPLAGHSREIWAKLRHESNVDLGAFRLVGSVTRRSVELDVNIDGTPGAALGVMSQGEINALALSIFLPRATMTESPFRFLVIDDPVQAMDPAKVDGLARVLAGVAASRQVIVFTHDNRLAQAVRNLAIPATILEVTRRPHSDVNVRRCQDPVQQSLKDAEDLSKDDKVPEEVARRVIPGLCRTALEAAFAEAFCRQQLRAGKTWASIDAALEGLHGKLASFAALGICSDPRAGGQVLPTLNGWGSRSYGNTYMTLKESVHELYAGDIRTLIRNTRALITKVEEKLR